LPTLKDGISHNFSSRSVSEEKGCRDASSVYVSLRLINRKQKRVSVANQCKN